MRVAALGPWFTPALLAVSACDLVSGLNDFDVGPATAGVGGGGSGGTGGDGGGAGAPASLIDTGLIARYFLDEAGEGDPLLVRESGGNGLDLVAHDTANLAYTETTTGRGLAWVQVASDGMVAGGGVADALQGTATATIEVVVAVEGPVGDYGRILHIGDQQSGKLALMASDLQLSVHINDTAYTSWSYEAQVRQVLHLRVDVAAVAAERAVLFVNGARIEGTGTVTSMATLNVGAGSRFIIGNRPDGMRSPLGTISYVALYGVALDPADIAHNADVLGAYDDAAD